VRWARCWGVQAALLSAACAALCAAPPAPSEDEIESIAVRAPVPHATPGKVVGGGDPPSPAHAPRTTEGSGPGSRAPAAAPAAAALPAAGGIQVPVPPRAALLAEDDESSVSQLLPMLAGLGRASALKVALVWRALAGQPPPLPPPPTHTHTHITHALAHPPTLTNPRRCIPSLSRARPVVHVSFGSRRSPRA
jgi:hypothetical protein